MILFSPMKKYKLVVILFLLLFAQKVYCEHINEEQSSSSQYRCEDELSFKTTEFFYYNLGDLPTSPIFFNNICRTANPLSANDKTRDLFTELFHSKAKVNLNLTFHQHSNFNRYSSVFQPIYLKTACFRL